MRSGASDTARRSRLASAVCLSPKSVRACSSRPRRIAVAPVESPNEIASAAGSDHVRAPRTFGTCAVDDNSVGGSASVVVPPDYGATRIRAEPSRTGRYCDVRRGAAIRSISREIRSTRVSQSFQRCLDTVRVGCRHEILRVRLAVVELRHTSSQSRAPLRFRLDDRCDLIL